MNAKSIHRNTWKAKMFKIQRALMVLAACTAFGAQAAPTITFDAFDSTTITGVGSHAEGGFQLSGDALTVIGTDWLAFYSTGSNSMISNQGNGNITLSKVGGGAFAFNMIDVSELGNSGNLSATNVHFIGQLSGGGTADVTIGLDLVFGNQTVDFGALFASVTSVSWTQASPFHQFDNLVIDAATGALPEPGALALVALALGGLGVASRRNKAQQRG